jgi:hypothetical protein
MALKSIKNLILIFISISLCFGCSTLFIEKFSSNKNQWPLKRTKIFEVKIEDGKLKAEKFFKNKEEFGCLWYAKTIANFKTDLDFTIEFDVKITKELDDYNAFDFSWGLLGKDNIFYNFSFSNSGNFRFDMFSSPQNVRNRWKYPPSIYRQEIIKRDEANKIKIVQKSETCFIYFNGTLLFKEKVELIYGSQIGFQHCTKTAWEIDNLAIKQ